MNISIDATDRAQGPLGAYADASGRIPEPHVEKLSRRARMLVLAGATTGTWGFLATVGYLAVTKL
jgi:hypothetical protein